MICLRKNIKAGLLVLVAGSMASVGALAEETTSRGPIPFAEFDKDGSGFVSEQEFYTARGERMAAKAAEGKQLRGAASAPAFTDIDTNGDGQLSMEEMTAGHKAHMGRHNGKGKGSGQTYGNGMKGNMPTFSDFDLDGDGKIVESEFNQGHATRMSEMAAKGQQMKHVGDAPGFSGIDSNGDGEISKQEFATHQAEHHQQMHNR